MPIKILVNNIEEKPNVCIEILINDQKKVINIDNLEEIKVKDELLKSWGVEFIGIEMFRHEDIVNNDIFVSVSIKNNDCCCERLRVISTGQIQVGIIKHSGKLPNWKIIYPDE